MLHFNHDCNPPFSTPTSAFLRCVLCETISTCYSAFADAGDGERNDGFQGRI